LEKAITVVEYALRDFEQRSGLTPRVVLLPRKLFDQYAAESKVLAAALPDLPEAPRGPEWTDVRVVEHHGIRKIEVY
jgi:hypothetical protein